MPASHTIESSHHSGGGPLEVATAKLWFLDLRRTAVVWLAKAGCTEGEIASISGRDIETVRTILESYLPRTGKLAASARVCSCMCTSATVAFFTDSNTYQISNAVIREFAGYMGARHDHLVRCRAESHTP